ncbi:MAG: BREX system ATP-binding domain-containing protein [Bradymonadaceae bacterium]
MTSPVPTQRIEATRTLEAMRLGVVPYADLGGYSVGREVEMGEVDADLSATESGRGAVRAFLGDYGLGKTHLLELIAHRALERNFLVMQVVLDAEDNAPSHPRRVYRALVRSLRYPDRPGGQGLGLGPLLEQARKLEIVQEQFQLSQGVRGRRRRDRLDEGMHLYLTPAMSYLTALDQLDSQPDDDFDPRTRRLLLDWIEGHPTLSNQDIDQALAALPGPKQRIYSLKDYRPWARIYGYLLSGLAGVARMCGYGGLVLLVDEAELYALLSKENRDYAQNLFKALSCASLGTGRIPFDASELDLGGYGILQDLPPRYGQEPSMYTVFAMTPNSGGIETLHAAVPADSISELSAFGTEDYEELVRRVCAFYGLASPQWTFPDQALAPLMRVTAGLVETGFVANPRQAMKFLIEFLDLLRHRPADISPVVRRLQERLGPA